MDLLHQYCVEVLGLLNPRILAAPAAKDVFNNFENIFGHEYFEKIPNTLEGIPLEGDIIFWGSGTWGHVAIFVNGDVKRFKSFDQNYPTGSPCHVQEHNYSSCLGWLRIKKENLPISPELTECRNQLADEIKKKNETWQELQEIKRISDTTQTELNGEIEAHTKTKEYWQGIMDQQRSLLDPQGTLGIRADPVSIDAQIESLLTIEDELRKTQQSLQQKTEEVDKNRQDLDDMTTKYLTSEKQLSAEKEALQRLIDKEKTLLEQIVKLKEENRLKFKKLIWRLYWAIEGGE